MDTGLVFLALPMGVMIGVLCYQAGVWATFRPTEEEMFNMLVEAEMGRLTRTSLERRVSKEAAERAPG